MELVSNDAYGYGLNLIRHCIQYIYVYMKSWTFDSILHVQVHVFYTNTSRVAMQANEKQSQQQTVAKKFKAVHSMQAVAYDAVYMNVIGDTHKVITQSIYAT